MKRFLGIVMLCIIAANVMAVPARREGMIRTDANGNEKTVFLHGNEFFHYMTDENGTWLDEETLIPLSEEAKQSKMESKKAKAQARRAKAGTGTERLLASRGAVILVSYKDQAFQQTNEAMTDWAMGDNYTYNGATGSIHRYFWDQSWGQYDMQIDVYGPVTASKNASYYGSNDWRGDDLHPDELVKEACKLAHDQLGADFSKYDSNNDGKVDWVVILYAGKGEADGGASTTIWPHQYDLSYTGMSFRLDGKTVDHYCCLNELDGQSGTRCGIGTFCHEFSHVMGLPDFYATTQGATHHTLCDWDIMDYGPYLNNGNTPPAYSAYERWFMGWIKPVLLNSEATVTLANLNHQGGRACYMTESGDSISDILSPNPSTFYLFENRQRESWDYFLPGNGLMITKVQWSEYKWESNTVNNDAYSMGVDIIEAKKNSGYYGSVNDLYPRGATSFTQVTNYQVTDIALENKIITFKVNGGGEAINLDVENIQNSNVKTQKIIENGRVIILREGQKFDILGNRL